MAATLACFLEQGQQLLCSGWGALIGLLTVKSSDHDQQPVWAHTPWWWVQVCIIDYLASLATGLPKLSFIWRGMMSDSSNCGKKWCCWPHAHSLHWNPSKNVDLQQLGCWGWCIRPPKWTMFDTYQYTMVALYKWGTHAHQKSPVLFVEYYKYVYIYIFIL